MVLLRVQASLQDPSGLARDRYINTFYVDTLALVEPNLLNAVAAAVGAFYETPNQTGAGIHRYLSQHCFGGGTVTIYDMTVPKGSRVPLVERPINLPPNGSIGAPMPNEIACCMSLRALPRAGWRVGQLRGRLYIGPLTVDAVGDVDDSAAINQSGPSPAFRAAVIASAMRLNTAFNAANVRWQIYSPKHDAESAGVSKSVGVDEVHVDDAWDIQRSRGSAPTRQDVQALTGAS